jgi:hypothetical protein
MSRLDALVSNVAAAWDINIYAGRKYEERIYLLKLIGDIQVGLQSSMTAGAGLFDALED